MSNTAIIIALDLRTEILASDGAVRLLHGLPGRKGDRGDPGNLADAIFPGHGTYPPNTIVNTLNALIDRKTEDDDFPDFSILIDNKLI